MTLVLKRRPCCALLLAAFTLRLLWLGGASYWYDEAYVWWAASHLPLDHLVALSQYEIVPPLHTLFLRLWMHAAGTTEFALRYPSLLAGVLAVAAGGGMARHLGAGRSGRLATMALLTVATPLLWASREARMYGFALTFTLLGDLAMLGGLYAAPSTRRRHAWAWAAMALLTACTVVTGFFWFVGQMLFVLAVIVRERRPLRPLLTAVMPPFTVAALLYLPWATGAAAHLDDNATYWPGYLPPATFWRTAREAVTTFGYGPERAATLALGLGVAALLGLAWRRQKKALLFLLTMALPVVLQMLLYRTVPKLGMRHLILFAPLLPLALGLAIGSVGRRHGAALLTAGTTALFIPAAIALIGQPGHADWRSLAAYVRAHRRPGDLVIIETGSTFPAWLYYAGDDAAMLPLPRDEVLHVDHLLTYGPTAAALRARLPGRGGNVWLVEWLAPITDPTALVPALLERVADPLPVPRFTGITLRRYLVREAAEEALPPTPPLSRRLDAQSLPALRLLGYEARPPLRRDRPLDLWLWWSTDAPDLHRGRFALLVLRLVDAEGVEWGRANSTPGGGDFRPERWPPNRPILGRVALSPLPWTPPGRYTLLATVSEGETEATLTLGAVALGVGEAALPLPAEATPLTDVPSAPLRLRGFALGRTTLAPCEPLEGMLFWESRTALRAAPTVTLTVGQAAQSVPAFGEGAVITSGVDFATRFTLPLDCRAPSGTMPLQVRCCGASWTPATITVEAHRTFTLPQGIEPLAVPFGGHFATLEGYRWTPTPPAANRPLTLTLYWRAGQTGDRPYSVFVHILAQDGRIVAQADAWPQQGDHPTTAWVEGEVIADPHPLDPLPPGRYSIAVGLYDADGRRLATPQGDEARWTFDLP